MKNMDCEDVNSKFRCRSGKSPRYAACYSWAIAHACSLADVRWYPVRRDFEYRINGSLDKDRLETTWKALIREHLILRTIFVVLGDTSLLAVQMVLKKVENGIR